MRRILIPLNGIENSDIAMDAVQSIVKDYGSAQITLLFVDNYLEYLALQHNIYLESQVHSILKENADRYFLEIQQKHPQLRLDKLTLRGNPSDVIMEYAESNDYDLIIMLSYTVQDAPKRFFFGSVTDSVLKKINVPVLVIPVDEPTRLD